MGAIDVSAELELATEAVRRAAAVCAEIRDSLVDGETLHKSDRSPVTIADFASQAIICSALAEESAITAIVGEERAGALRTPAAAELRARVTGFVNQASGRHASEDHVLAWIDLGAFDPARASRYWTLDPIDGTKGFLRGGHYAIALALIDHGEVVLAALACPGWDCVLTAARGEGTLQHPLRADATGQASPVRVSPHPSELRFCESVEAQHSDHSQAARIAANLGITQPPLRMDSQAKYAAVARGDAAIYLRMPTRADYRELIWDHAAGMLIVQEAGGRVTDINGAPLDFGHGRTLEMNAGIIASHGTFHDDIVAAVGTE